MSKNLNVEEWLAIRKEEGLKIDPDTAEVDWVYAQTLDPYGVDPKVWRWFWPLLEHARPLPDRLASRTMKQAWLASSNVHGGGKRRTGMAQR